MGLVNISLLVLLEAKQLSKSSKIKLVLRECRLQTDTQHAKRKWRGIKVGKEKCNLKDV